MKLTDFQTNQGGRKDIMDEFNTLLLERLPCATVFTRDQQVVLDDQGGCYAVFWGKGSQQRASANLCPTGRTVPVIIDCFGDDLEKANRLYDALKDVLTDAELRGSTVVRCEDEVLVSDETQTDAVRAIVLLQYVA